MLVSGWLKARSFDGLLSKADLGTAWLLKTRSWVYGGTGDSDFFLVDGSVAWRVDGGLTVFDCLAVAWLVSGWVDGGVDTNFFAV